MAKNHECVWCGQLMPIIELRHWPHTCWQDKCQLVLSWWRTTHKNKLPPNDSQGWVEVLALFLVRMAHPRTAIDRQFAAFFSPKPIIKHQRERKPERIIRKVVEIPEWIKSDYVRAQIEALLDKP